MNDISIHVTGRIFSERNDRGRYEFMGDLLVNVALSIEAQKDEGA